MDRTDEWTLLGESVYCKGEGRREGAADDAVSLPLCLRLLRSSHRLCVIFMYVVAALYHTNALCTNDMRKQN